MRLIGICAGAVCAFAVAVASPAPAATMSEKAGRLTTPGAVATWDMSKLHKLDGKRDTQDHEGLSVDELEGMAIVNVAGERIGEVKKVLADQNDRIVAVTVDVGGFLGIGGKEVIVGVDRLELRQDKFATAMSPEELKQQPEWDR